MRTWPYLGSYFRKVINNLGDLASLPQGITSLSIIKGLQVTISVEVHRSGGLGQVLACAE